MDTDIILPELASEPVMGGMTLNISELPHCNSAKYQWLKMTMVCISFILHVNFHLAGLSPCSLSLLGILMEEALSGNQMLVIREGKQKLWSVFA